jgi:uncharacterized membrane protein
MPTLCVSGVIVLSGLTAVAAAQPLQSIGTLPPPFNVSFVNGVSADGLVVVGYSASPSPGPGVPGDEVPIRWTAAGGMEPLGSLGGNYGVAVAASADGSVITGQSALVPGSSNQHPFRWTRPGGMVDLGLPAGAITGGATGISSDGSAICGSAIWTGGSAGFRWTPAGMQSFGTHLNAMAISADGAVIVCRVPSAGALWTPSAGLQPLPVPPGWSQAAPSWISGDGLTVYGAATEPGGLTAAAYRWTAAGGYQFLPSHGTPQVSGAERASADGSLILGYSDLEQIVWTPRGTQPALEYLQSRGATTTGWTALRIRDFTPDARTFVGNGVGPDGRSAGWIVTLPSTCYANCDGSNAPPVLNVLDFVCFGQQFAAGNPLANCDASTTPPVLNVLDFACFQTRFAAGCP